MFGGRETYSRARTAAHARAVDRRVARASVVTRLPLSLAGETFAAGALATGRRFGLSAAQIGALFGTDLAARERRDRRASDRLIRELGAPGSLGPVFGRLRAVRAHFDVDPGDLNGLLTGMSGVQAAVTNRVVAALDGGRPRPRDLRPAGGTSSPVAAGPSGG